MRTVKVAGLFVGALLMAALPASAMVGFRGGFVIGPAFGPLGWYGPGLYGPYGPYPAYYANVGEIKLSTNVKDADVFINGAYAGKAAKLKSMWLAPDGYNLEVRAAGYAPYSERVYVVPGKTMRVDAQLTAGPKS